MLCGREPTEKNSMESLESMFYSVLSGLFFSNHIIFTYVLLLCFIYLSFKFLSLLTLKVLSIYYSISSRLIFQWDSRVWEQVVCFLCLLLGLLPCLFVLTNSNELVLILLVYYILYYDYYSLKFVYFLMRNGKGLDPDGRHVGRTWEE